MSPGGIEHGELDSMQEGEQEIEDMRCIVVMRRTKVQGCGSRVQICKLRVEAQECKSQETGIPSIKAGAN